MLVRNSTSLQNMINYVAIKSLGPNPSDLKMDEIIEQMKKYELENQKLKDRVEKEEMKRQKEREEMKKEMEQSRLAGGPVMLNASSHLLRLLKV